MSFLCLAIINLQASDNEKNLNQDQSDFWISSYIDL